MEVITSIDRMCSISDRKRKEGSTIGLVPTMGALHEGHLSLVRTAGESSDCVVVSIFVNPAQFGPNEDLERYPRDLENDKHLIGSAGGHLIFAPEPGEMYPDGYASYVNVERLTAHLCGKTRPTHFRGVTTVVAKLFNIVNPHTAFFGQKDAQQLAVIKRMVRDLNIQVDIVGCPIVRESDGLAMSSRNSYLTDDERNHAPILYRSLCAAKELVESGITDSKEILDRTRGTLSSAGLLTIEYVELVDPFEMTDVRDVGNGALLAIAGRYGKTRLIDNILLKKGGRS
ncbi:pantoate--beta-alanine ligase [Candidatus Omnitrophota bacterium]